MEPDNEIGFAPPASARRKLPFVPILVVALAAGAAVVSYRVRLNMRLDACHSNLRTLESCALLYAEQHHSRPPDRLDDLLFVGYLPQLPICPLDGKSGYRYESQGAAYTVTCKGGHRQP